MTDVEVAALTALVQHQAVIMQGDLAKYGELQFDPWTPEVKDLTAELDRRRSSEGLSKEKAK